MDIKTPMIIRLYAGDVLVAEADDSLLFSAVLAQMLPKRCNLCMQVPRDACCLNRPAPSPGESQP